MTITLNRCQPGQECDPATVKARDVVWARTARYGPIKTGQLFKIGKRGTLVTPRNLAEAEFVAVQARSILDISRTVKVKRYRYAGGRAE